MLLLVVACEPPVDDTPQGTFDPGDTAADADTDADTDTDTDTDSDTDTDTDTDSDTDTDTDTDTTDTDTVTDAAWPASSVCVGALSSGYCPDGMSAESWDGAVTYTWLAEGGGFSSRVYADGAELFVVSSSAWFEISGLAVAADGDLFLAGSTFSYSPLTVDGAPLTLTESYSRFVIRVSTAGDVRWYLEFGGVSVESLAVAPTNDNGVLLVGELSTTDTEIDTLSISGGAWTSTTLMAALDEDGDGLWAATTPSSYAPPGEFQYSSIEATGTTDVWIHGAVRGEITIGTDTITCSGASCAAYITMASDGTLLALTPE